jgi:hypothetical protein
MWRRSWKRSGRSAAGSLEAAALVAVAAQRRMHPRCTRASCAVFSSQLSESAPDLLVPRQFGEPLAAPRVLPRDGVDVAHGLGEDIHVAEHPLLIELDRYWWQEV